MTVKQTRGADLGIVGGSGLYEIEGFEDVERVELETPFGAPSDAYMVGTLDGVSTAFLPRHGVGHRIAPHELNFRANIHGFRQLGVRTLISLSAVGSLREEVPPGDFVVVDQFIDRTHSRPCTFFEGGAVAHVSLADPVCAGLGSLAADAAREAGANVHEGGTYICIQGPQFSTRAESHMYRSWGGDVIGMTNVQEARLAREAQMCFASVAMSTDYDCWREEEEAVDVTSVLQVLHDNAATARSTVRAIARRFASADLGGCACRSALEHAVITAPDAIDAGAGERLALLIEG